MIKIYSVLQETAASILQTDGPGHFLPEYMATPQNKIIFTKELKYQNASKHTTISTSATSYA